MTGPISLFVCAGGIKTHFFAQGSGSAVLFVHGGGPGSNAETWLSVMHAVAARRQAFALDLIGFGGSNAADVAYTSQRMVDHVADVLDALCLGRVLIVGHSLGATIAARVALQRPERVAALAMVAPGGGAFGLTYHSAGHEALARVLAEPSAGNVRALVRLLRSRDDGIDDDVADRFAAIQRPEHLAALRAYATAGRGGTSIATPLAATRIPILLAWGAREQFNPPELGDRIAANLPSLRRYAVFAESGHYIHYDEPDPFAKTLVDFFDEVEAA